MVITHHGAEFFKVSFGDTTLALNPISKDSKLKGARFGADVALISLDDPDMNGAAEVAYGERQPFVIAGPGEYEVKGVTVKGFLSSSTYREKERINTIYFISLEGMNLCFLGALADKKLPQDAREALEDIDILFIPVGGDGVLSASDAHDVAILLEPKIVIPMHYDGVGEKGSLAAFLKEEGADAKPVDKLTLKKKDLEGKEGEVVVLSAQ